MNLLEKGQPIGDVHVVLPLSSEFLDLLKCCGVYAFDSEFFFTYFGVHAGIGNGPYGFKVYGVMNNL